MPRQAKICCWRDHIFGSDDQWCTSINHLETRDWMILGLDQRWLYWYHWLMVMVMGHWLVMVPVSHGAWLSWNALINWSCFHVFPDQNAYHHLEETEDHQNYACSYGFARKFPKPTHAEPSHSGGWAPLRHMRMQRRPGSFASQGICPEVQQTSKET